ncbi:MAG: phosphoribosylglycinamide formyltransferase [Mariprofundaceae bacterium]|nr:phosphoribosylglycinamide formyltransferase [Mariprofundaceae bacterium]
MSNNLSKIAVLASGKGSNLDAILTAIKKGVCPVDVRLVLSDLADAGALRIARDAHIPHVLHLDPKTYENRACFDAACADAIESAGCHWVVLAGYMRILSNAFVARFPQRIVNIHPSLLPAFVGGDGVGDALRYGVKITGCTVHLVNEVLDCGPILAQKTVAIHDDDDRYSLLQRMHEAEHQLYPQILADLVQKTLVFNGRTVKITG